MTAVETVSHDGWVEVVLNRPEKKNAINGPFGEALAAALQAASDDEAVQAIVLRGAGGAFCSGLDLTEFNADPKPEWHPRFGAIWRGAHKALFECQKPIIAALERYAINGGAALALAADVLIVGEGAFLQVGEIKLGMAAPYNIAWLRLRYAEHIAATLALSGRRFHGPELLSLGVAYECVTDETVTQRACELAAEMAGYPPGAGVRIKTMMRADRDGSADEWFDRFTGQTPAVSAPPGSMRGR